VSDLRLRAGEAGAGIRLDRFLAEPLGSRARAQALIEAGAVTVDGRVVAKRHVLAAAETVAVALPDEVGGDGSAAAEPGAGEGTLYTVAFEDDHLLVVDKAPGVVVHPARGHWTGTLAQALAARGVGGGEDPARAGIVHRLDRDTSGLLVVARSDDVHRALRRQLSRRELRREYRALVEGAPQARTGTIEAAIGRDRRDRMLMSIDTDAGRDARTHFEVERLLGEAALLRIVLDTGRTHQIRVHLAAIGLPVAGDPQYGHAGAYGLRRQFLHAARLAFAHPVTGEPVDVVSELPDDLREALARAAGP
jgi:23S rRNA pseudouridine1911/1915/1917 synthase